LLNVDSGSGYKTVLEAFCQTEIPMPESGRWASAGMVRGRGVDLAWVVKDASKHFRTPQRRKRLYLIVDYSEQRAGEILFVTKSLSGYFTARESQGQGITANAESGAGDESKSLDIAAFMAGQAKNARSIAYSESVSPTLKGSPSGLNQVPCVCEPRDIQKTTVYGICSYSSNSMLSGNPDIGFYEAETSRTLDKNCCYPANHQGGLAIVEPQIARTLTARADSSPCVDLGQNVVVMAKADIIKPENPGEGLQCVHPLIAGTLCASAAGLSRPAGMASETDLCVAYCQKNPDVTAVDCRNFKEEEGISGTLQSKSTGGYSLNFINPIRIDYIVRRLTPTEAERLMSLPDDWTKYGHDGKLMSDSARYSMCGNSIVVNVLAYIMRNIAELLYER
jgi:DNA (cytosine-5)-methyltransferase 1